MRTKLKLALTASIAMLALTLFACEDKEKKQTTAEAATETTSESPTAEQPAAPPPTQEAAPPTPTTFTDTRDNKTYKIVKIGTQVWMAENLNYEVEGSMCYDNKPDNCKKYGRLYDWETAKKACPSGWKLPSDEEWDILMVSVGGKETAGKFLKTTNGWNENGNGNDKYGFSALPGGSSSFEDVGDGGYWWSSSERDSYDAYHRNMYYYYEYVAYNYESKEFSYSVRCIQN